MSVQKVIPPTTAHRHLVHPSTLSSINWWKMSGTLPPSTRPFIARVDSRRAAGRVLLKFN
eukprot:scaffold2435_cov165-Amphora_coffeaeformis.AAC.3